MGTIQGYNFEIMIVNIFFHLLDFLMESLNTVVEKKKALRAKKIMMPFM